MAYRWSTDPYWAPGKIPYSLNVGDDGKPLFTPPAVMDGARLMWPFERGYLHAPPEFFEPPPPPPDPGSGDPRLEKTYTVSGWTTHAEGMTAEFLCQDPTYTHPYPLITYYTPVGDPPPPTSFRPPFQAAPNGPSGSGVPQPPCPTGEPNPFGCDASGAAPNYNYPVAVYETRPAFPVGENFLVYSGLASGMAGVLGIHSHTGELCRCWHRVITVTTKYFENNVLIWQTTVTYTQYFNGGGGGPITPGQPNPNVNAGSSCTINITPDDSYPLPPGFPAGY